MCRSIAPLLVALTALAAPPASATPPFEKPVISMEPKDGGVELTVELTPVAGADYPTGAVPFTAEPFTVVASPASRTAEYDLFGSGLAMDLDGDGGTSGAITLGCFAGGVLEVGGTPHRPFVETADGGVWRGNYRNPDGTPRVARVGSAGAWFAVYTPCGPEKSTSVGLSPADQKMRVHEVAGPVLQLLVFEEVFVPSKAPTVTVTDLKRDGRKVAQVFEATTHAFEPLFDARPVWYGVVWRMISLGKTAGPRTITARLAATDSSRRRMVVAIVNTSPAPGIRARAGFAHTPVSL
ncbi:MAG: hypothetical protein QF464_00210 [Myxococcota bacterium]|nr:hypothetical protein [Myxococcota bacterium]